jgi:hypothetical protein
MSCQLVLTKLKDPRRKAVGENVLLENIQSSFEVYLLYYPGAVPNQDLETALRNLGEMTGNNLFVNIGKLNDPSYRKIVKMFGINKLPVIILTASDRFASIPNKFCTAYIRLDDKKILNSRMVAIDCIQTLFNLFIDGKISEAIQEAKGYQREAFISHIKETILPALKVTANFLTQTDFTVSLIEGKLEIKHNGGNA